MKEFGGSDGESQGKGLKNQTAAAGPPEFAKVLLGIRVPHHVP